MYNTLDPKNATGLLLVRKGWFHPEYELTDNVNSYGKLSYNNIWRCSATATLSANTWVFKTDNFFGKTILIKDQDGNLVGKVNRSWFGHKAVLTLQSGFRAKFSGSFFSCRYKWDSDLYGMVMEGKGDLLSIKDNIYINQTRAPISIISLLMFLGKYLNILSKQSSLHS